MNLLPLPGIFLLGACLFASTGRCVEGASSSSIGALQLPQHVAAAGLAKARKVVVEFYSESLCPDCKRFTSKTLEPMFANGVADYMDLQLIPYGNAAVQKDGTILCQHGAAECRLNEIFGCIVHEYPDQAAWFPVIACIERASPLVALHAYHKCMAASSPPMEEAPVTTCLADGLGHKLQLGFADRTAALDPPHTGVPWVVVDGTPLHGDDLEQNLQQYVCDAIDKKQRPRACIAHEVA